MQSKAVIFLFVTQDVLDKFRISPEWTAGVDASCVVIKAGANGDIDLNAALSSRVRLICTAILVMLRARTLTASACIGSLMPSRSRWIDGQGATSSSVS